MELKIADTLVGSVPFGQIKFPNWKKLCPHRLQEMGLSSVLGIFLTLLSAFVLFIRRLMQLFGGEYVSRRP